MKKLSLSLMCLLLLLLLLVPSTAYACSCEPTTIDKQFNAVDAVFAGRVVSIREDVELPETGRFVTVEVVKDYKGGQTGQVVVKTGFNSSDCGIPFREGTEWLVYAYHDEQPELLSASSCGLTKEMSQAHSDLVELGFEQSRFSPGLLLGLLVLLGALVWLIRRRRKRTT